MTGLESLTQPFLWYRYSKKLIAKFDRWRCAGIFTFEESNARDMHLSIGSAGNLEEGFYVKFHWIVDKEDGIIVDAKFQCFGPTPLLLAAETACLLLIGKNYDQAKRVTATLIDQQVRDKSEITAFPSETAFYLNLILEAIDETAKQCEGIPLSVSYTAPPASFDINDQRPGGYPNWIELSKEQKLQLIEEILNQDVRPYIALDGGGVNVIDLIDHQELRIAYEGSCTSCYSSVGSTLSYIQQVLRAKLHSSINVIPDIT